MALETLDRIAKLAAFGQKMLDLATENGLLVKKRKTRRKYKRRKPAAKAASKKSKKSRSARPTKGAARRGGKKYPTDVESTE